MRIKYECVFCFERQYLKSVLRKHQPNRCKQILSASVPITRGERADNASSEFGCLVDSGPKGREDVITGEGAESPIVTPFKLVAKAFQEVFVTWKRHYVGFELEFTQRLQRSLLNFDGLSCWDELIYKHGCWLVTGQGVLLFFNFFFDTTFIMVFLNVFVMIFATSASLPVLKVRNAKGERSIFGCA